LNNVKTEELSSKRLCESCCLRGRFEINAKCRPWATFRLSEAVWLKPMLVEPGTHGIHGGRDILANDPRFHCVEHHRLAD
jgi:hypothetical protein